MISFYCMIISIFGKKGSGKSSLSKNYMVSLGGRVIFVSPVEPLNIEHKEIWELSAIPEHMQSQRPGEVLLIRLADVEAVDVVCAQSIYYPLGYTLVIDEVNNYRTSRELTDALHYSRHFNINLIGNTRRYADMPRLFTSQSDELCFFQTNEPRDLDYINHFCGSAFAVKCQKLSQYTFLQFPSGKKIKPVFSNF